MRKIGRILRGRERETEADEDISDTGTTKKPEGKRSWIFGMDVGEAGADYSVTEGEFLDNPAYNYVASEPMSGADYALWSGWRLACRRLNEETVTSLVNRVKSVILRRGYVHDLRELYTAVLSQKRVVGPWSLAIQRQSRVLRVRVTAIHVGKWEPVGVSDWLSVRGGRRRVLESCLSLEHEDGGTTSWSLVSRGSKIGTWTLHELVSVRRMPS